jgi:hypothetical protein
VTAVGYVVKAMSVKIDDTAYECAVTSVSDAESSSTVTTQTACEDGTATDTGPSTWVLNIAYNLDWTVGSLHRLLRDNAGDAATVVVEYDPVGAPGVLTTYDVTLKPGSGTAGVGAYATGSVALPVKGQPSTMDPDPGV